MVLKIVLLIIYLEQISNRNTFKVTKIVKVKDNKKAIDESKWK